MSTYEKLQRKADNVRDAIEQEVGSSTMDLIDELIELERELTLLEGQ